jgi:hypothetical protein
LKNKSSIKRNSPLKYDFSVLSPEEFEELVNKLLADKDVVVEQYRAGKDDGYDGYRTNVPRRAMIQVKHYASYETLKSKIQNEEIEKIKKAKPVAYVLATSFDLTHHQTVELKSIISAYVKDAIVLGYKSICELLDNNPKVLKSMVKLWSLNAELIEQILHPEKISRFYQLKNRFDKINEKFVKTPDLKRIQKVLDEKHVVLISGEPGVGKTTLAEYLCFYYLALDFDIEIFEGDFTRESYNLNKTAQKVLYYFDDFLGSNYLNCISDKSDSAIVKFMDAIQKEPNKLFILTSRTNIVNRAYEYSQPYRDYRLKQSQYIVDVGKYDVITKAQILRNHLKLSDLEANCIQDVVHSKKYNEIIRHRNFNPRLIEFVTRNVNFEDCNKSYLDFVKDSLDNPKEIWHQCFTAQLNQFQRLLVKLVVANRNSIEEKYLKSAYERAKVLYNLPIPEQERVDYEYTLSICERCILNRTIEKISYPRYHEKTIVTVFNPSVSDYVLPSIKNDAELEKLCSSLRTVESILFIELMNEKNERKILKRVFQKYENDEWDDAKLKLMDCLNEFEHLDFLIDAINHNDLMISQRNRGFLLSIISKIIDKYDWSDFLDEHIEELQDDSAGYCNIYEVYKDSSFCKKNVLDKIRREIVKVLKNGINDRIFESFDYEFDENITRDDVYQRFESIQEDLVQDYQWLDEDDLDEIQSEIDASFLVDQIKAQASEDRWASERDDYEDEMIRPKVSDAEKIDKMFSDLIQE